MDGVNERDISKIDIDNSLPKARRVELYIEQIGDPYSVIYDNIKIRLEFADDAKPLEEKAEAYFIRLKGG